MKNYLVTSVALASWIAVAACGRLGTGDDMDIGDGDNASAGDGDGDTGEGDGDSGDGDVGDGDVGDGDIGDGDVGDGDLGDGDGDTGLGGMGGTSGDGDGDIVINPGAPSCTITSPRDNASVPFFGERGDGGEPTGIKFKAKATDREDGELTGESITWFLNSFDNDVGSGNEILVEKLPPGENKMYCVATDSDDLEGIGFVHVVSLSPLVFINHPGDQDGPYPANEDIVFSAVGFDYEEGDLDSEKFVWHSSIEGELGDGNGNYKLDPGEHKITVTAWDSDDNEVSAAVHINVMEGDVVEPGDPSPQ